MSVLGPPVGSAGTRTGSTESLAKTVDTFSDVPSKGASGWAQAKGPIELSCVGGFRLCGASMVAGGGGRPRPTPTTRVLVATAVVGRRPPNFAKGKFLNRR